MKRVGIAIVLLMAVIILSGGALFLQYRTTDRLMQRCDELMAIYQQGDISRCRDESAAFSHDLERDMRWFPFFLKHERMESIFQQAAALPYLVSDEDSADFFTALAAIRTQLEILINNEWPTPSNIM